MPGGGDAQLQLFEAGGLARRRASRPRRRLVCGGDTRPLFDVESLEAAEPETETRQEPKWSTRDRITRTVQFPFTSYETKRGTVSATVMVAVFSKIERHAGNGWWPVRQQELASHIGKKIDAVKKAVEALCRLQLLQKRRMRSKASAGTACNHYRVNWSKVREFTVDEKQSGSQATLPEATSGEQSGLQATFESGSQATFYRSALERTLKRPPPPPTPSTTRSASKGWAAAVARQLIDLGVEVPRTALEPFQEHGGTLESATAIIAHYRQHEAPNGWGPGALHARLKNHYAGQPVGVGWPECKPGRSVAAGERSRRDELAAMPSAELDDLARECLNAADLRRFVEARKRESGFKPGLRASLPEPLKESDLVKFLSRGLNEREARCEVNS